MSSNKKYWKSVEELKPNSPIVETLRQNEFVEKLPVDEFLGNKETLASSSTSRRDFLKYVGFSTAAASLAACEGPVNKSIPYVVQPDTIIPGVANYYATCIANGYDFASILVKTREGRPIKIENNKLAKNISGANARVNASVLDLYDSWRLQGPMRGEEQISWDTFSSETLAKLNNTGGKSIVLLTQTFASPSTTKLVGEFQQKFGNVKHVVYDTISEAPALDAYQAKYGKRGLADYNFAEAKTIVSFAADFLGDWQGGGFDSGYSVSRVPTNGQMSKHYQFEANMSLTGANADVRVPLKPSHVKRALARLHAHLNGGSAGANLPEKVEAAIKQAADALKAAGNGGVVVTGLPDINAQKLVLEINESLGSKAFKPEVTIMTRQGNPAEVSQLVEDMKAGNVGALIMCGVNPLYSLPNAEDFAAGMANTDMTVCFSMKPDETAVNCDYMAATPHYLEWWGDVEFKTGHYGLIQPVIRNLFDTRQFQNQLLVWMDSDQTYQEYVKENWSSSILGGKPFNQALHDGVFLPNENLERGMANFDRTPVLTGQDLSGPEVNDDSTSDSSPSNNASNQGGNVSSTSVSTLDMVRALDSVEETEMMELSLFSEVALGDGKQANNPWLQELPDPITRVSWDNYVTVNQLDALELGLFNDHVADGGLNGSYANLTVDGTVVENVPVIIQPGQARGTVGLAFGYGRNAGLKDEMQTGVNAYPLYKNFNSVQNVVIEAASGVHEFACVQLHNTLMGRGDIIKETTLEIFNTKPKEVWNAIPVVSLNHEETPVTDPEVDLWGEFDRSIGHHFNLSIDLNACTGCAACVIACHSENNVPVVGKKEVRKSRDMHWLRIDRYYSSEESFEGDNEKKDDLSGLWGEKGSLEGLGEMEDPAVNPQVAFQPVMCQHCNHAPCETVCPVAATSHGRQGQNHMAYNRCVGTRYCANNCPYKVRRFNWFLYAQNDEFDYHMNDDLGRMVLNPDVVVRSRGVMEKCSMCIQKTQKVILDAKREGRKVRDGEFHTACSAACNNGAIVFGDINEEGTDIVKLKKNKRMYHLLESVGTKPNVMYQTKVRNV